MRELSFTWGKRLRERCCHEELLLFSFFLSHSLSAEMLCTGLVRGRLLPERTFYRFRIQTPKFK